MNSNKSVALLSRNLIFLVLIFSSCNPYHQVVREKDPSKIARQVTRQLELSYPFSGHKGIDWNSYQTELTSLLSGTFNDSAYLKVRELFYQIPDARWSIQRKNDQQIMRQQLSGYAGFHLSRDAHGTAYVVSVDSSSTAWKRGLRPGNLILGWNGQPVKQVIRNKQVIWGVPPASAEIREIKRDHFMTIGKVGESIELFFENNQGNTKGIRIPFEEGNNRLMPEYVGIPGYNEEYPLFKTENEIGILTIREFNHKTWKKFSREVLPQLENIRGLVIDLRENVGGQDIVAAKMAGFFVTEEQLYEDLLLWSARDSDWMEMGHTHVYPDDSFIFTQAVILLIGPKCNGAGEGFARVLVQEESIHSMGIWKSAGSFSYPGGKIKVPGKFQVNYPVGMAVDGNGSILLESPGDYGGGIYPDIRISGDAQVLIPMAMGYDLLLQEALRSIR